MILLPRLVVSFLQSLMLPRRQAQLVAGLVIGKHFGITSLAWLVVKGGVSQFENGTRLTF